MRAFTFENTRERMHEAAEAYITESSAGTVKSLAAEVFREI